MTRTRFAFISTVLSTLALSACAGDGIDGTDDTGNAITTLPSLLADAPELAIDPAQSMIAVHASLDRGERVDEADVTLIVERGAAVVSGAGDQLNVELTMAFAQVALPSDIRPGDLRLIDISTTTLAPMTCTASWTSDIAWCGGELEVQLDWSLAEGDSVYPLGSQPLRGLSVNVAAILTGDTLTLQIAGDTEGTVWSWAGVAELRDLSLHVTASASVE
jgi:hypothetical protein